MPTLKAQRLPLKPLRSKSTIRNSSNIGDPYNSISDYQDPEKLKKLTKLKTLMRGENRFQNNSVLLPSLPP